jgi:predicted component of type VI protein secretion system
MKPRTPKPASLLLACLLPFAASAGTDRSVAQLAELAAVGPVRAQMSACARLHAGQAADYTAALDRFSTLVADSLRELATTRAADLQTAAPEALFLFMEGLMGQYAEESKSLSSERCQFLANDLNSLKEAEFRELFGQTVSDLLKASTAYRDGVADAIK